MGRAGPCLDRSRVQEVLTAFLDRAMPDCSQFDYRIVGTAAALLQGVSLPAGDIDVLVRRREGVDAFYAALEAFPCLHASAWLAGSGQYFARYQLEGVEVELSTVEIDSDDDCIETFGRGPWEHFNLIPAGRHRAPVVALELRLLTEVRRGRPDRYAPLLAFLRRHGCDTDFLRRGLSAGVPATLRDDVLEQLAGAPSRAIAVVPPGPDTCHG